jgi:protein arginine kinase activator
MQCQSCGSNEAVIHHTRVVDNEMQVEHLCHACALEQGIDASAPQASAPLVDFLAQIGKGGADEPDNGGCPSCGMTQAELKRLGRLGCAQCYEHFEQHLRNLLRRLHGGTQHVGKISAVPESDDVDRAAQLQSLRRSLQRAIEAEDFEHAAALRDQIRRLEPTS